jgi:nucleoside-diphosphate-sugar epimerase
MRTVALTGATGFVGRFTLKALVDDGWHVRALARTSQTPLKNVRWIAGSLADRSSLVDLMQEAQCLVHVAGATSARNLAEFLSVNVDGTANVVEAAKLSGVKRIIHVSSLTARRPDVSDYAQSKYLAEKLFAGMAGVSILRLCAVYGEGDQATLPLIRELMKPRATIPGRSGDRFSMVHAEDVGKTIAAMALQSHEGLVDISDGRGGHDWAELAAITRKHFGTPRHIFHIPHVIAKGVAVGSELVSAITGKPPLVTRSNISQLYGGDWVVDNNGSLLANHIGLEEGLSRTIEGYQKSGQMPKYGGTRTGIESKSK